MPLPPSRPAAEWPRLAALLRAAGVVIATLGVFALTVGLQRLTADRPASPALLIVGTALFGGGLRGLVTLAGAAPRTLGLLAMDVAVLAAAAAALLAGGLVES